MPTPPSRIGTLVLTACCALLAPATHAQEPSEIQWREDYSLALREAHEQDRLVWIQFTGPWCPNCRRMERDSFPAEEVVTESKTRFVPLKLRSDVNEQLAAAFQLTGLPATVIVAPDRSILAVHQGYLGPDELTEVLKNAHRQQLETKSKLALKQKKAETIAAAAEENRPELDGYCPVSLVVDRKLRRGSPAFQIVHNSRIYHFASAAERARFEQDPTRFVPANDAYCPVRELDEGLEIAGKPRFGAVYAGRLYLCASAGDRARFLENPARYAAVDVAQGGFCPHCLTENGLLVRGDPRHRLSREGKLFWFPDPSHRDAFLASNP